MALQRRSLWRFLIRCSIFFLIAPFGKSIEAAESVSNGHKRKVSERASQNNANKLPLSIADPIATTQATTSSLPFSAPSEPGQTFRDCSDCPEMIIAPPGVFTMGVAENDGYRDEQPPHLVTIQNAFAVGRYEVTFNEWDYCVSENGCQNYHPDDAGWGRGKHPVINVSWRDAQEYIQWINRKTKQTYRLLSESEWEYVARAGTSTHFNVGTRITTDQANFDGTYVFNGSSKGKYRHQSMPVGSFSPNIFGLYDMHGNVREWVEDCYNKTYQNTPTDSKPYIEASCEQQSIRSGSWNYEPFAIRSSARFKNTPTFRIDDIGFRVARSISSLH
ncbi:formylglycine-generating enzyme [Azospirillaceae bacterium]